MGITPTLFRGPYVNAASPLSSAELEKLSTVCGCKNSSVQMSWSKRRKFYFYQMFSWQRLWCSYSAKFYPYINQVQKWFFFFFKYIFKGGDGKFLYIDSAPQREGDIAKVTTRSPFPASVGLCHLRFWFYMQGSDRMGTLKVIQSEAHLHK